MKPVLSWLYAALLISTASSCISTDPEPASVTERDKPLQVTPEHSSWSPQNGEHDPVVATVGPSRIHLSELKHHIDAHQGNLQPREVLRLLIEVELLSQHAYSLGYLHAPEVFDATRSAAVAEYLYQELNANHGYDNITEEDFQRTFKHPGVRVMYDHFDAYLVMDVQIICCRDDWTVCAADPETQRCLDSTTPMIAAVHQELIKAEPFETEQAITATARGLQASFPRLRWNKLKLWYKQGQPYAEQKGFTKYNVDLVETIVELQPGDMGRPVRSHHGWHIPLLLEHQPEEHRTLEDPGVRRDIAEHIYPQIQSRDYLYLIGTLEEQTSIEKRYSVLEELSSEEVLPPQRETIGGRRPQER